MNKEKADQAVPFIIYKEKEGFKLNPEAEEYLKTLNPNRKIAVISIVGKYRTGKSFFVNRVLLDRAGKKAGFSVGPTINPCTKGLWIWKETLYSEELSEDVDVILIDTEGFGGMDENQNHDSRIFLFSLLLSSYFIYNSQGNIDETALNNISLIINLSKDIKVSDNNSQDQDPADFFPSFLWVVRDFALQMVDTQGQKITSKDYLERALENQKGVSDAIEQKNRIRRQLKHFFKDRDCATLVRPIEAETDLQRLNEMQNEQLRPEFITQISQLRKKIFRKIKPKIINGKALNGQQLVEICKAYIQAINKGTLPNIENAWNYMCKNESIKAMDECLFEMQNNLEQMINQEGAISSQQIHGLKSKVREELIKNFKKKSIASEEELKEFYEQLDRQFAEKFRDFKKKNKERLQERFQDMCSDRLKEFESKLNNEEYSNYYEFQKDFLEFKDQFERSVGKSPESDEYFKKISESIYRQAAEKVNIKQQRELEKEKRILEQKIQLSENDLKNKRQSWEDERRELQRKIQDLERERAQLMANEQFNQEKIQRITQERDKLEKQYDLLQEKYRESQSKLTNISQDQLTSLQRELETVKSENMKSQSNLEKENALLQQENKFCNKENERLTSQLEKVQTQIQKYQQDYQQSQSIINQLKNQMNALEVSKKAEIEQIKTEFQGKIKEAHQEKEQSKDLIKQQSESLVEKAYLENQVQFLQSQLDENKRLHDALLLALQQGMQKDEGENTNELVETNKNLSAAMDKLEQRCGMLDEKVIKLKEFKRMVKNCTSLQCINCSKFIANRIFLQHLNNCSLSTTQASSSTQSGISRHQYSHSISSVYQSQILPQGLMSGYQATQIGSQQTISNNNLENGILIVNVSKTIVRESSDNKPYTDYIVSVNYQNQQKWEIPKKYKNFCELHHTLTTMFPSMKFPESSLAIINANSDLGSTQNQKRPSFIEERRKALSVYLRDLCRIDQIRNSKVLRNFLELDMHVQNVSFAKSSSSFIGSLNTTTNGNNSNNGGIFQNSSNNNNLNSNSIIGQINEKPLLSARDSEQENDFQGQNTPKYHQQQPSGTYFNQASGVNYQQQQQSQQQQYAKNEKKIQSSQSTSYIQAWQNKENKIVQNSMNSKNPYNIYQ
ncbi:hypothetical protein ABPG72_012979 [Tetrahymena utriculariae]